MFNTIVFSLYTYSADICALPLDGDVGLNIVNIEPASINGLL